ncbi:hypothetical protein LUZ60_008563 [Juncus effusus]|nr:hypothetical protein LUZ60_008563 [Juncus effusus]
MVWFQCEDCGENLKKPKLASHFRICSAYRVSCIDCGVTFDQESVQGHTQCITEAEKYGPKHNGIPTQKTPNSKSEKPKPNSDVDINVGLSSRPPWYCSLCKTTTTSKQTLLGHADGKKHRAKARAFHAQNNPKKDINETPVADVAVETPVADVAVPPKNNTESEEKKCNGVVNSEQSEEKNIKRKREEEEKEGPNCELKKKKGEGEKCDGESKINWKKIITSTLKSNDGVLKVKKLKKQVIKMLRESGVNGDKDELGDKIMSKVNSSSRFMVENRLVKLVSNE